MGKFVTGNWAPMAFISALCIVLLLKVVPLHAQNTCDFGALSAYNLISKTGGAIWNSDIEGKSAFGGTLQSGNFSYGIVLPPGSSPALQVAGDINVPGATNNIQVYNGNVRITGAVTGGGSVGTNGYLLQTGQPSIPLNINSAFTTLQSRASIWSALTATGTVSVASGIVTLNGLNSAGVVVFNLAAGTHTSTSTIATGIYKYNFINCANAQSILINVSGTDVKFYGGLFENYPSPNKIIWNFYQATTLEVGNWGFKGTILAPYSYFNFNSGHLDGNVFVNYINGSNGEVHNRPFMGQIGTVCTPPSYSSKDAACNTTAPCAGGLDALSMPGFFSNGTAGANYRILSGEFTQNPDSTAYFFARIENVNDPTVKFDISFIFNGKTSVPGTGNPWNPNGCTPTPSDWTYYSGMSGSIVGVSSTNTDGVIAVFTKTGTQHVQLGFGGTGSQATAYGLGASFSGTVVVSAGKPVSNFAGGILDWIYCSQPSVCNNVTSAGAIGSDQSACTASYDPSNLTQTTAPSGGSGALEYQWQISTNNTNWADISGANSAAYNPPVISSTTYYRRAVKRANCFNWLFSNTVQVTVYPSIIQLSTPTVSGCINQPLQDISTVSVSVSWANPYPNDTIEVSIFGKTVRINVAGGVTSPQSVTFNIPANGVANQSITAIWRNHPSICPATTTFNAPAACSNDSLNCNILYLCGQDKPQDGPAWDHGFMHYLDTNNGTKNVAPILTKPDASGMGTYDVNNPSTFVTVNLSNYDLIVISATTEAHIAPNLVSALKQFSGAILNSNYELINDLGMAGVEGSYQFQTNAYTNNTTSVQIYNYNNINPNFNYVFTRGNYLANADATLWTNAGEQAAGINGIIFTYDVSDVLPGVNAGHGRRVYLGYHMNGIYANPSNGGVQPSPASADFDPARHLTTLGKSYFDQALISASLACATCTPNIAIDRTLATCSAGVPNNDGHIDVVSFSYADKIGVSAINAANYNGPNYASLPFVTSPVTIVSNIPNTGASYYLRIFNGSNTCYKDTLITVAANYCPAPCPQPLLAMPCYVFGSYQGNSMDAFVSLRTLPSLPPAQNSFNMNQVTHLATHAQVGCIYGTAYHLASNSIFTAAYIKRHSALGPGGTGAIYKIDPLAVTAPSVFVDLNALFGANTAGVNPHPYSLSDQCPASGGGTSHFACWFNDVNTWDAVGRQGLGDMDISEDGNSLFVMNMTNKSIYQIPTTAPTVSNIKIFPFPVNLPGAISSCGDPIQVRPMGLGVRGGKVYAGAICTDEVTTPSGGIWGGDRIYIYALDPLSGIWTKTLEGSIQKDQGAYRSFVWPATFKDTYADGRNMILSDIDFDNSGQMIIGIRDVSGDRYGSETGKPIPADGSLSWYSSSGDILKACKNASTGLYELEQNGVCGGVTSTGTATGQGLGGVNAREFYHGDLMYPIGNPDEISLGSVAFNPGSNLVYVSAYDLYNVYQQGLMSLDNTTGARVASYALLQSTSSPGQFGKTNGFGDLEMVNCCTTDISTRDSAICSGIGVNLANLTVNVDGGFGNITYYTSLTDALNNTSPLGSNIVAPSVTTKYYIRKAIIPSCFDIDSVLISVYQPIALSLSAPSATVCTGGSILLTVSSSNLTPDCTLQWQSFNGSTWSDIPGAIGTTYATPALSTATNYRVRATCTANQCADNCPAPGGG